MHSTSLQRVIDVIDELNACAYDLPGWLGAWGRGREWFVNLDAVPGRTRP
jgi:hypothetical protein